MTVWDGFRFWLGKTLAELGIFAAVVGVIILAVTLRALWRYAAERLAHRRWRRTGAPACAAVPFDVNHRRDRPCDLWAGHGGPHESPSYDGSYRYRWNETPVAFMTMGVRPSEARGPSPATAPTAPR